MGLQPTELPASPITSMQASFFNKRKHDPLDVLTEATEPKKVRIEVEVTKQEEVMPPSPSPSPPHSPPSPTLEVLEKTSTGNNNTKPLVVSSPLSSPESQETEEEEEEDDEEAEITPRVIVEHQPLPSIYELQQNTAVDSIDAEQYDSGLSDDSSEGDSDEECIPPPPLYDAVLRMDGASKPAATVTTPPNKAIYNDRFWSQGAFGPSPPSPIPPPAAPQQANGGPPYQFLDQTNQRIECAENGKSYMQLGTMNTSPPHLPVTPVIQPKPNMVYRRPIPPFRNPMLPQPARPVCDHSNCLQRKNSHCYKNQRGRMLNVSLHKLHMARQNHEGSLRRSVLICNMLRNIEEETEREAITEAHHHHHHHHQVVHHAPPQQHQQQQHQGFGGGNISPPHPSELEQQYWSPPASPNQTSPEHQPLMTPSQYNTAVSASSGEAPTSSNTSPANNYTDTYETTLKDFNTAFRLTPYSSPLHSSEMESGLGGGEMTNTQSSSSSVVEDEDRGINWSSVLSLSNQSELDPLNNNSFAGESWASPTSTTASAASQSAATVTTSSDPESVGESGGGANPPASHFGVDDIGWKLSADDVLRAFPSDDQMFAASS